MAYSCNHLTWDNECYSLSAIKCLAGVSIWHMWEALMPGWCQTYIQERKSWFRGLMCGSGEKGRGLNTTRYDIAWEGVHLAMTMYRGELRTTLAMTSCRAQREGHLFWDTTHDDIVHSLYTPRNDSVYRVKTWVRTYPGTLLAMT